MDSDTEPVLKKRRLSPSAESEHPESLPNYITIAHVQTEVVPTSASLSNLCQTSNLDLAIAIRNIIVNADSIDISLSARGLSPVIQSVTCRSLTDIERRILDDCSRLEPSYKYNGKTSLPIACSSGRLVKSNSQLFLDLRVLWEDTSLMRDKIDIAMLEILRRYLPACASTAALLPEPWEPREFYDNVHVPTKSEANSSELEIEPLKSQLYPFQRRTVRWMLSREGVRANAAGQVSPIDRQDAGDLPHGFALNRDAQGGVCYVNHALGVVTTSFASVKQKYGSVVGGLLADEMGLGKTLGVISTVCLHKRPDLNTPSSETLRKSGATLIITPPTILDQWKQEIREHAPSLNVYHYEGLKSKRHKTEEIIATLSENDIVLTTYNVISKEVHYVQEKPDRNLRNRPRAEPPKSPLTEISWWRVCLDEAQMVETGVSAAATVARLIPRVNAWAVTGTPLRKGHRDLFGLLLFLRFEPWCHSTRVWDTLISYFRPLFQLLIGEIAIRHSKDSVREELRLPPQSRHTITIPFTLVEEQHYDQLYGDMCEACGLDRAGAPLDEEWDPDEYSVIEKMRTWLTRLRQTCLHPEVGVKNRKALGRSAGPLRTVGQVLDVMIDQNEGLIRTEQRSWLTSRIRKGQLQENAKEIQTALSIWKAAYEESCVIADECRTGVLQEIELRKASGQKLDVAEDLSTQDESEEESDADTHLQTLKQRLRSALEVKHICIFFMANAYFQLKSDETNVKADSEEFVTLEKLETQSYELAKSIRGELLAEVLRKANRLIKSVALKATPASFAAIPEMEALPENGGIESRKIYDKLYTFCEAMNLQAKHFDELRKKMMEFLQRVLIDEDEGVELQGDEYETSTKVQDEMYAYMEALRACFADRSDAISGQENLLIRQEMKQFNRAAKEGEGPAPELMLKLLAEREEKRIKISEKGSLRGIVAEVRQLITSLQWSEAGGNNRARLELDVTNRVLQHSQQLISTQTKSLSTLEQEVNLFRDTMNSRLDYYRALQKISDTVAPYDEEHIGEPLDTIAYQLLESQEGRLADKVSTLLSKRRYLMHLKSDASSSTSRICTICQQDFDLGTLTVCGHQFCKECIQLWWSEHRNCPVCKRKLAITNFHDITYRPLEMVVQAESPQSSSVSPATSSERSHNQSIYSDISTSTLNQIKNIELQGSSFGSKVDLLVKHILWLREHDPGTKSIIFSQYRDFVNLLARALDHHKISFSHFDDKNGIEKFKNNPAIECFLLHAKAHSAGLNLVVASHVVLCEPMLATAVELQAIARIHRIGQHQATTIWMYIVSGTVEESIYDISVARRLAHINRNAKRKSAMNSRSVSGTATPRGVGEDILDAANSFELQAADLSKLLSSGKSGGELVDKDDLWQCLFGKAKKREAVVGPESQPANSDMGRFLRAEAAESRNLVSR